MFASNAIGARIWLLTQTHRTSAEIARHLADEYGVSIDLAERDVRAFLQDLVTRGLLREERSC